MTTARFCHWCGNPDAKERIRGIAGLREYCETCEIPTSGPSVGPVGDLPEPVRAVVLRAMAEAENHCLHRIYGACRECELDALLPLIRAHIADQVRALPRRTGTPEWSSHREVAQAVGYDVGLGAAEAEVRHGT